MKRDHLVAIIPAGKCRRFSKAIGRLIFCDDMTELRAGKKLRIPDGELFARFVGDVPRLGLALFLGKDGGLYAMTVNRRDRFEAKLEDGARSSTSPSSAAPSLQTKKAISNCVVRHMILN